MHREAFDGFVAALPEACRRVCGERLRSLAVVGSVARRTQRPDSDIDVLLVIDDLPAGRRARMKEFERIDALLEPLPARPRTQGVHMIVSPVLKTPAALEAGSLLYLDMVDQARILVDEGGLLRKFLDALGARLAATGAQKVRTGGGYYWVLAPNFRWGDRIEL